MSHWRIKLGRDSSVVEIEEDGVKRTDVVSVAITQELNQPARIWLTVLPETVEIEGEMVHLPDRVRKG